MNRSEFAPTVYLLASKRNGTLYLGVTTHLVQRIQQHRDGSFDGFSKKYAVRHLVWFESHDDIESAILREKRVKKWRRAWKLELIEKDNAGWRDLAVDFGFEPLS